MAASPVIEIEAKDSTNTSEQTIAVVLQKSSYGFY
jgi:hypothetical protein